MHRVLRPRPTAYVARLAAGLAVAALSLTSCGDGDATARDEGASEQAVDEGDVLAAVTRAVAAQERVHLTIGDGGAEPALDVLLATPEPRTMQVLVDTMPGEGPPDDMEIRLVDGTLYIGGEVSDGWRSMPADDPRAQGEDDSFDAGFVPAIMAIDPAAEMAALEEAATGIEEVGREEVEAVDTIHWRVTVDTDTWTSAMPDEAMQGELELPEALDVDLWVGPDDLPVRISYAVGTIGDDKAVNQVDYVEWDPPVDVATPKNARPLR